MAAIGLASRPQIGADREVLAGGDGGPSLAEPLVELLGGAVGGHGQFARQSHRLGLKAALQTQRQQPTLHATPGGGHGVGAVCGRDHRQPADARGEGFGEGQADAAAVGGADEGLDHRLTEVIEQQGQQPGLIMGGDGDDPVDVGLGQPVERQHPEPRGVERAARAHGPTPPARSLGVVADPPTGRDAPGHNDERTLARTDQAGAQRGVRQPLAGREAEVVRQRQDDLARRERRGG